MDRQGFLKLLGSQLHPILRREGFKGSGATLRRIDGDLIHVFNFQGSKSGTECYLNVGAHLSFLPPEGGLSIAVEAIEEPDCVFRGRIESPSGRAHGWAYGNSTEEAERCVEQIVQGWATQGHSFFGRYASFPDSFVRLLQDTQPTAVHARVDLHLARIAAHLGRRDDVIAFARAGLASAHERATLLRQDLEELLAAHGESA